MVRQSEVQNLCLSPVRHEDVRGLNVPVNDSFRMRCIQGIRNLDADIEHCLNL